MLLQPSACLSLSHCVKMAKHEHIQQVHKLLLISWQNATVRQLMVAFYHASRSLSLWHLSILLSTLWNFQWPAHDMRDDPMFYQWWSSSPSYPLEDEVFFINLWLCTKTACLWAADSVTSDRVFLTSFPHIKLSVIKHYVVDAGSNLKLQNLALQHNKTTFHSIPNKGLANAKRPCDCRVLCLRLKSSLCSCAHSI